MAMVPPSSSARPPANTTRDPEEAACRPVTTAKAATSPSFAPKTRSRTTWPPRTWAASEWAFREWGARRMRSIVGAGAPGASARLQPGVPVRVPGRGGDLDLGEERFLHAAGDRAGRSVADAAIVDLAHGGELGGGAAQEHLVGGVQLVARE